MQGNLRVGNLEGQETQTKLINRSFALNKMVLFLAL
jgi:hypothetical protein